MSIPQIPAVKVVEESPGPSDTARWLATPPGIGSKTFLFDRLGVQANPSSRSRGRFPVLYLTPLSPADRVSPPEV